MVMEGQEQLFVPHHFLLPLRTINILKEFEGLSRKFQTRPVDVVEVRRPANRRLFTPNPPTDAIHNPLKNPHILAVSRPQKSAIRALPEPIHMKDPRCSR